MISIHKYLLLLLLSLIFIYACEHTTNPVGIAEFSKYRIVYNSRDDEVRILTNIYDPKVSSLIQSDFNVEVRWSPNGDRIAYNKHTSSDTATYARTLTTIKIDSKDELPIAPMSRIGEQLILGFAWSPDGGKIAYISSLDADSLGEQNIWVVDADGKNRRKLTSGGWNLDPIWWPDSRKISFQEIEFAHDPIEGDPGFSYTTIDIETGQVLPLLPQNCGVPAFSPDGQKIAYFAYPSDQKRPHLQLYYGDIHNDEFKMLLDDSGKRAYNMVFGFSENGDKIYFLSRTATDLLFSDVYIEEIGIDGMNRKAIKKVMAISRATLSPDAQKILLWFWGRDGDRFETWFDLYVMSVDGTEYFKLIEEVRSPDWAPILE